MKPSTFFLPVLLLFSATVTAAEKPLRSVADLRYGVVLYEYFQSNHFEALSELMIADVQGGIQGHKDNPELIEGSLNLAYGMDRRASEIYDRLLNDDRPLSVRNAAWFYLAKIRYLRGDVQGALASLEKIEEPISKELAAEKAAMDIQLLIDDKQFSEAETKLADASSMGKQFNYWRPYLNFNLGAYYARNEEEKKAQTFFSKVIKEKLSGNPVFYDEQFALYDKAYIAAGFGYFQEQNYPEAIESFGRVRQTTPLANDALLGFGWAKAKQGDYQGALVPWTFLSQRPLADDAVQEALIAIPFAYIQLGDINKALAAYAKAETIYLEELNHIDESGSYLLSNSLIEVLDLDNFENTYSWLVPERNTLVKPVSRYLLPLMSSNGFQAEIQTLVDLHRIRRQLEDWKQNLSSYRDLMDYRLRAFRLEQTPDAYRNMSGELLELQQQRDEVATKLNRVREQRDVYAYLDEDRQDLVEMVNDAKAGVERLAAAGEWVDIEREWVERYQGLLFWSASQDFDVRIWEVQSALNTIDEALASATASNTKITQLLTEAPDITEAKTAIDRYEARVNALLSSNGQLMAGIEENIRQRLFAALALQRQRVQFYLGESRLALAQLYDNEYLKRTEAQ